MNDAEQDPMQNTDTELFREVKDDYYAPSVHVTRDGKIGMNVGGLVIVLPIREWHGLANPVPYTDDNIHNNPAPLVDGELQKQVIQFQKDTLAEWEDPAGRNVDMIKLADRFTKDITAHFQAAVREAAKVTGETSDDYHTFNELYDFRKVYNALLFNEWAAQSKFNVYKSKLHHDGEIPFGGGWFVVGAQLPSGQITNHYELKDWYLFTVPEVPRASKYDGHSPQQALQRMLQQLNQGEK